MFSDTITFTDLYGTADYTLTRINQDGYSSEYLLRETLGEFRLTIRNVTYQDKKRGVLIDRHTCQLTDTRYPVAPSSLSTVRKAYFVFEVQQGDAIGTATALAYGLAAFNTSGGGANITKMANFES